MQYYVQILGQKLQAAHVGDVYKEEVFWRPVHFWYVQTNKKETTRA